jgi:DNA-binding LacI/PurR family transcriptional regulator
MALAKPEETMSRPQLIGKVVERILRTIADGTWSSGSALPSVRRVASEFGVSACTALAAVQRVAQEGLLDIHQGRPARVLAGAAERARQLLTPKVSAVRHRRVAILISDHYQPLINHQFYAMLVGQITRQAEKRGLEAQVVWWPLQESLPLAETLPRTGYEGAVFVGVWETYLVALDRLREQKFPVLLYNYEDPRLKLPTVIEDLYGAAQHVADYLVKLGHRSLCLVAKPIALASWSPPNRGVGCGWMDYLADHGLLATCQMPIYLPVFYRIDMFDKVFRNVLRSSDRPTALVFSHSPWAQEFLADPEFSRLKIPDELSLATFETTAGIPVTPSCPPLTYSDINHARTAECLVETLLKMLAGEPHQPVLRVKLDLTITESVGPPVMPFGSGH